MPRSHSNCSNDVGFTHSEWLTSTFLPYSIFNVALKPAHPGSSPPFGDTTSQPCSITQQYNTQSKMAQYTINNSDNCCNTTNCFYSDIRRECSVANDRSQILTWLSSLEPRLRHREVQERRVDNIGEWLTQTEEFRRWCGLNGDSEGNNPVLFCYGDPGVGKTFIR